MGSFSWLKQALEKHQKSDCRISPEAENFVADYSNQVAKTERALLERQEQERQEQERQKKVSEGDR